jgi:integrase
VEPGRPFIAPRWLLPIKATIFSGLRVGELFALAVRHLDFARCQIRVEREVVFASKRPAAGKPRWHFKPPKSKAGIRCVDVSRDLMDELRQHIQTLPAQDPDQLLFPTQMGTPVDPKLAGPRGLYPALKRGKMTKRVTWHDLRHTYAAIQIDAGAEAMYLKEQMGHESIQVTYDVYGHLLRRRDPDQAAKAYARVFGEQARAELRAIRMEGGLSDVRSNGVLTARRVEDVLEGILTDPNGCPRSSVTS